MSDSSTPPTSDSSAQPTSNSPSDTLLPQSKRRRRRRRKSKTSPDQGDQVERSSVESSVASPSSRPRHQAESTHQAPRPKRSRKRRSRSKHKSQQGVGSRADSQSRESRESAEARLRRAVELIDSVTREHAVELGVMRLSTLHLNLMIGEGETTLDSPTAEMLTRQVEKLQRQISGQVRALVPTQFQRGTLYCFSSDQGITPPKIDAIFTGYDPLGRPLWTSFLPLCLSMQLDELCNGVQPLLLTAFASTPCAIRMRVTWTEGEGGIGCWLLLGSLEP